jgi:hypothetical protein
MAALDTAGDDNHPTVHGRSSRMTVRGVERPGRAVRFTRLIHRRGRAFWRTFDPRRLRRQSNPALSQVAFRGVTGDRRHGLSAQDAVSWATSWLPVVAGSGWSVAMTRAMEVSER